MIKLTEKQIEIIDKRNLYVFGGVSRLRPYFYKVEDNHGTAVAYFFTKEGKSTGMGMYLSIIDGSNPILPDGSLSKKLEPIRSSSAAKLKPLSAKQIKKLVF